MASDEQKKAAVAVLEAGLTALGLGYVHGRKGEMPSRWKIPLDAAVGAGGVLLGVLGGKYIGGDKVARHLVALGTGGVSYFMGSLGGQFGQKARFKAKELRGPAGPYLTGDEKDASTQYVGPDGKPASWRNNRTITAGFGYGQPQSRAAWQPAPVGYGRR